MERELDRELRYHVDRRVEDLIKEGISVAEARRRASIEFGGMPQVQEEVRDTWTWRWLDSLVGDVRYSLRGLLRSWGFAVGTIAVLALAIGATTAVFSVVNTVLLQPLPYPGGDRIVAIETFWTNTGLASEEVSLPDFRDWQAQNDVFESMAHFVGSSDIAVMVGERPDLANSLWVSPEFFSVFGQTPAAGRLLTEADVPTGGAVANVVVARHEWAESHFGSAQAAVGKTISVYDNSMQIVGVTAPGFSYPGKTDLWAPSGTGGTNRNSFSFFAVGRLKRGVDFALAQAQMRTIGDNLAAQHPENRLKTVSLVPLQERLTGNVQMMLWVLMAAVFLVLLIACANISNLLLARGASRTRELALRAAIGAGRGRLVRQLLTESLVLGALAGAAGLVLVFVFIEGLVAMAPADLPRLNEVRIDTAVLLFALGLSFLSTLLFGLVPALQASRLDLANLLKQGGSKGVTSSGGPRAALVVAEVALSVVLLATAGLLLRSFQVLQDVDLGFTTERVHVAFTEYPASNQEERRGRIQVYANLLDEIRRVPGVSAAAGVSYLPMGREPRPTREYAVQGRPEGQPGERPETEDNVITPGYFETLEIPILAGRDFAPTDTWERPMVAIVNETLARAAFPGESPLGKQIQRDPPRGTWFEIVGVVADTRWQDPSQPPPPVLYMASVQEWGKSLSILTRSSLDQASLEGTLRTLIHEANPNVPFRFETMDELFMEGIAYPQFRAQLIGAFAAVAALLAGVGIFSVLSYLVGQRTREIAVRRAVGAQTGTVVRLIFGQGMRLVALGLLLGIAGALAAARLLKGLLYEISPWHPGPFIAALAVIGVAAVLATLIPAVRAATIAPLLALQQE